MPRDDYKGIMEYIDDALAMLKEQEAKLVEFIPFPVCPVCKKPVSDGDGVKYCCYCGQAVKWE